MYITRLFLNNRVWRACVSLSSFKKNSCSSYLASMFFPHWIYLTREKMWFILFCVFEKGKPQSYIAPLCFFMYYVQTSNQESYTNFSQVLKCNTYCQELNYKLKILLLLLSLFFDKSIDAYLNENKNLNIV